MRVPEKTLGMGIPEKTLGVRAPEKTAGMKVSEETPGVGVSEKTPGMGVPKQTPGNEGLEQALVSPPLAAIWTWSRVAGDHLTAQPNTRDQGS